MRAFASTCLASLLLFSSAAPRAHAQAAEGRDESVALRDITQRIEGGLFAYEHLGPFGLVVVARAPISLGDGAERLLSRAPWVVAAQALRADAPPAIRTLSGRPVRIVERDRSCDVVLRDLFLVSLVSESRIQYETDSNGDPVDPDGFSAASLATLARPLATTYLAAVVHTACRNGLVATLRMDGVPRTFARDAPDTAASRSFLAAYRSTPTHAAIARDAMQNHFETSMGVVQYPLDARRAIGVVSHSVAAFGCEGDTVSMTLFWQSGNAVTSIEGDIPNDAGIVGVLDADGDGRLEIVIVYDDFVRAVFRLNAASDALEQVAEVSGNTELGC